MLKFQNWREFQKHANAMSIIREIVCELQHRRNVIQVSLHKRRVGTINDRIVHNVLQTLSTSPLKQASLLDFRRPYSLVALEAVAGPGCFFPGVAALQIIAPSARRASV
jgi:hypothetical protein